MTEQPQYPEIARKLAEGKVVVFLGSGASLAGVAADPTCLPTGSGLAQEILARLSGYPGHSTDPLTKIAQYYEECVSGRSALYDAIRDRFYESQRSKGPPPIAEFIASLPHPLVVVTTNYDPFVEIAYARQGKPYKIITHATNSESCRRGWLMIADSANPSRFEFANPKKLSFDLDRETVIYKSHGTFGPTLTDSEDTVVITENDYADFFVHSMRRIPPAIIRALQTKHILFLGYSLQDWNFRVILRSIHQKRDLGGRYHSWAVQRQPEEIERHFWERRNIHLYDVDLIDFIARIRACL